MGTGLPLTTAMFWAKAGAASRATRAAASICFFMVSILNQGAKRATAMGCPGSYHFDRQGMKTLVNEILQRIIHKAMALNASHTCKQW